MDDPKNYVYDTHQELYFVRKRINGKTEHFGSFKTEQQAKLAVELYNKTGWHKEDSWAIRAEVHEQLGD